MTLHRRITTAFLLFAAFALGSAFAGSGAALGQDLDGGDRAATEIPHLANGRVSFEGTGEGTGVWTPLDRTPELGRRSTLAPPDTIPFQPWARALYDDRQIHELEPHARCKASGVARRWQTPYGVEFVQAPDVARIYLYDIGGPHTFHTIYMDGRTHPDDFLPDAYGHSVGWWEGDTLVVDTVGFSEGFWLDRTGLPHTTRLHTLERFTRIDFDTVRYEVRIDDPGAYTRPWTGGFNLSWSDGTELFEYICQQQNQAPELQVSDFGVVDRTSPIVP